MSEPTYVGMPGRGESNQLRLTIMESPTDCFTECTVRIPHTLAVEAGTPPKFASVGDDWLSLAKHRGVDDEGFWELEPEGLAMKFLRLAWLCAHDEVMRKHPQQTGRG